MHVHGSAVEPASVETRQGGKLRDPQVEAGKLSRGRPPDWRSSGCICPSPALRRSPPRRSCYILILRLRRNAQVRRVCLSRKVLPPPVSSSTNSSEYGRRVLQHQGAAACQPQAGKQTNLSLSSSIVRRKRFNGRGHPPSAPQPDSSVRVCPSTALANQSTARCGPSFVFLDLQSRAGSFC